MSRISNAIRAKRFQVRKGVDVQLLMETELGDKTTLIVRNCSITGIGAWLDGETAQKINLEFGKIIPESKLLWSGNEVSLGRLTLRSRTPDGTGFVFGFSCIDTRVPLMGSFSLCFESLGNTGNQALEFELSSHKFNLANFTEVDHSHADLFQKCREYALLKSDFDRNPLWQFYPIKHSVSGLRVKMSTPKIKKPTDYVNFASYDYFGFSTDQEVKAAASAATAKFGLSATASPALSGKTVLHEELEAKLSQLLRKEDTILFSSGFAANVGTLTGILGANDLAVADILCHASIHDGLSASRAKVRLFRHNNYKHLSGLLEEHRHDHAGTLLVSEGIFSMDGDVPNVGELVKVAKGNNARVFFDEVHSFGVLGPTGLGASERYGVLDDIDMYMGSLSKGMGAGGGFVSGSKEFIQWLRAFARSGMFSSGLPASSAAGALKSLEITMKSTERRERLAANVKAFLEGLRTIGYSPRSDSESPIIPVVVGDAQKLSMMNQVMLDFGVYVNTVVFPAVPVTGCRFRFSISAAHSESDIQLALVALKRAVEVAEVDLSKIFEAA